MDTGGSFPGVKRPGCETGHSPPASSEANNTWLASRHTFSCRLQITQASNELIRFVIESGSSAPAVSLQVSFLLFINSLNFLKINRIAFEEDTDLINKYKTAGKSIKMS
jgi:hypothetical protein